MIHFSGAAAGGWTRNLDVEGAVGRGLWAPGVRAGLKVGGVGGGEPGDGVRHGARTVGHRSTAAVLRRASGVVAGELRLAHRNTPRIGPPAEARPDGGGVDA